MTHSKQPSLNRMVMTAGTPLDRTRKARAEGLRMMWRWFTGWSGQGNGNRYPARSSSAGPEHSLPRARRVQARSHYTG